MGEEWAKLCESFELDRVGLSLFVQCGDDEAAESGQRRCGNDS